MPENTDDTRLITILLIVIGAIIILPMGFGMMGFGSMMGGMWGGGMWGDGAVSGWMFIVGIVMQLLFLVALVGESISSTEPLQGVRATPTRQWRNSGSRMLVATSLTRSTNSRKPRSNETPEASPRTMAPTGKTTPHPLPLWIEQYTTAGLYGLVLGTVLCLVALFTDPIPDPSFPWATLPASLRLSIIQPRIEHWPVTYTVGIWLWIFCFPALFFAGYQRFSHTSRDVVVWLTDLPTIAMLEWTTYCRFFWPKLHPPTWNAPAYTFVCWAYCSTYDAVWSNAAYAIALLGVFVTILALQRTRTRGYALLGFGILALPLGLPALYEGYRQARSKV